MGDWDRFTGSSIGAYLELVPSEHSSGQSRAQGGSPRPVTPTCGGCSSKRPGITAHMVYRGPGVTLQRRWDAAPAIARARGHAGNQRLYQRWVNLNLRKKRPVIANVAVARELAGWCWSLTVLPN